MALSVDETPAPPEGSRLFRIARWSYRTVRMIGYTFFGITLMGIALARLQRYPPLSRDYIVRVLAEARAVGRRKLGLRGLARLAFARLGLSVLYLWFTFAYRKLLAGRRAALIPSSDFDPSAVMMMIGSLGPGGAERQAVTTLRGLLDHGYTNLSLVALFLDGEVNNFFRPQLSDTGIPVSEIRRLPDPPAALTAGFPDHAELHDFVARHSAITPPELVEIWHYLVEILERRPGVFHGWMDDVNVKGGIAAAIAGVPRIVLSTRSVAPDNFGLFQPFMRAAYRTLLRLPQVTVLNNSAAGARDYERWLGVPPGTIQVVRNGFDFAPFDAVDRPKDRARYRDRMGVPEDACLVGTIIRFSEEKQPLVWVETAARVARQDPALWFLMLGDGPLRDEARARASALGLADRLLLPGYETDALGALAAMDLFLLTSRVEGLPNVLIEAQAMGVPVVAADVGGTGETFRHGEGGWLVARPDTDAFASAVESAVRDPEELRLAGHRARAAAREAFDARRMVRETLSQYFEPTYERTFDELLSFATPANGVPPERPASLLMAIGTLGPGGAERQLANLLRADGSGRWNRRTLLGRHFSEPPHDFFRPMLPPDVAVIEMDTTGEPFARLNAEWGHLPMVRELVAHQATRLPRDLTDVIRYLPEILRARPTVVHAWLDEMNAKVGVAAALAGVPRLVLSTRNVGPHHLLLWLPYFRAAYRALARLPSVVIVNNSAAGARDYEEWLGLGPGAIRVVHNGLDLLGETGRDEGGRADARARLGIPPDAPLVGTVIRFAEEKDPFLWLRVARIVADRLPAARFVMVGAGPLYQEARELAASLGIAPRIVFTGRRADARELLRAFDVFLLTSTFEGLPNVLIEAQAEGVPVLSTDAGGARETFEDGSTGVLLRTWAAPEIAQQVVAILQDDRWRRAAGEEAPQFVRDHFSIQAMVERTSSLYD